MQAFQQNTTQELSPAPFPVPRSSPAHNAVAAYRKEEYSNLSPVQVIYKLYEVAIRACKCDDRELSRKAINELIVSLNFEHEDVALGLYRLYDYSKRCIRQGKTSQAVEVLEELRSAWGQAFKLQPTLNE
jgi:flagellin-specific chaperone FliS